MAEPESGTCFVMSPFGGYNDSYYRDLFAPAIRDADLQPRRADDIYGPSAIVADIWREIRGCSVGLADLTGRNANVLYELGLAHAIAKPVVLIVRSLDDVPFDLRQLRVVTYDVQSPDWVPRLQSEITQALREVLSRPARYIPLSFVEISHTPRVALSEPDKNMVAIEQQLASIRSELTELRNSKQTSAPVDTPPTVSPRRSQRKTSESEFEFVDGFKVRSSRSYVGKHFAVVGQIGDEWQVRLFKGWAGGDVTLTKKIEELPNEKAARSEADGNMPDPVAKWKSTRDLNSAFR